jgi:hypothetical protein
VQKHSREGYNIERCYFLPVFGQPVATRRRTRLEGVLAVFGEIRGGGPVWDVESGGTVCVLAADCQRPPSRARLKPETIAHARLFDYKASTPRARLAVAIIHWHGHGLRPRDFDQ